MDKIEVTQNARQAAFDAYLTCYEIVPNDLWLQALLDGKHDGDEMAQAFARFERDILATRTDATLVAWHSPLGGLIEARQIARQAYKDIEREKAINGHVPGNPYDVALAALNSTLGCLAELVNHPPATDVAALVEAAKAILHAVCHETGFAAAVRADSGLAYPWEPLDIAEAQLRQALAPFTKGQP